MRRISTNDEDASRGVVNKHSVVTKKEMDMIVMVLFFSHFFSGGRVLPRGVWTLFLFSLFSR